MTVKDVYEACLIEANKVQAPALLLSDFIYFLNKAIKEYVNKKYNTFEMNLQATDDLRVLIKSIYLEDLQRVQYLGESCWECALPNDYVHILNCTCVFNQKSNSKCSSDELVRVPANKLNTNEASRVVTNYYMKPSQNRPYFYIINMVDPAASKDEFITTSLEKRWGEDKKYTRYGNATIPKMLIRCGNKADLLAILVDYLVAPQYVTLDPDELDDIVDNSQLMEFPDYVMNEIIKEVMNLILENSKDLRLQTFIPVNQSIGTQTTK